MLIVITCTSNGYTFSNCGVHGIYDNIDMAMIRCKELMNEDYFDESKFILDDSKVLPSWSYGEEYTIYIEEIEINESLEII